MDEKIISMIVKFDFKALRGLLPAMQKEFQTEGPAPMMTAVKGEMAIGKSPVEGQGRYQGYSELYVHDIKTIYGSKFGKRQRPVNLNLSGTMVGSMYSKPVAGGFELGFQDKKADFHDRQGAGKRKVLRRMLPTRAGEVFSRTIMQKVMKLLQNKVIRLLGSSSNSQASK